VPGRGNAEVIVYGAEGCHLCETALRVIDRVRNDAPFELEVVDITGDPDLESRYRERIPVVLVGGEEMFTHFVYPGKLRHKLDEGRSAR
jgi:hypothetical protein